MFNRQLVAACASSCSGNACQRNSRLGEHHQLSTVCRFLEMALALDSDFTSGFWGVARERPVFDAVERTPPPLRDVMAWSVDRLGGTHLAAKGPRPVLSHVSHPRVVLTGVPRWALADIFVSYTSSDRAGGHPWIRSGGTHGAKRTFCVHGSEPPSKRYAHRPRCYLRRGDVGSRAEALGVSTLSGACALCVLVRHLMG
jgi:hypothetical protein